MITIEIDKVVVFHEGYCVNEKGNLFFKDIFRWCKIGDVIKQRKNSKNNTLEISVNEIVKTKNYYTLINNINKY